VLIDAQRFPRDKTCGDGLVPDAHAALRDLGVLDEVLARARRVPVAHCIAPRGLAVDVPGELAVLPRRDLDALLCRAARQAGARMVAPARFLAPLRNAQGRMVGARVGCGDEVHEIQARWSVLATGAVAGPIEAAGVCTRRAPSAIALRAHVRHAELAEELGQLRFIWHPRLQGGYGWIFPGPDGVLNLGVGVLDERAGTDASPEAPNLRRLFDVLVEIDAVAARAISEGEILGGLKGAPLRCDLEGAEWAQPGLLVVGDAVGATYSFTGEGIGKALETGLCAARAIATQAAQGDAAVIGHYQVALQQRLPRFRMYRRAASFNRRPWLLDLVVWRAQHGQRTRARLADILGERRLPDRLLSWRGLRAMLLG